MLNVFMEKRGISAVVSTVLLISLVVIVSAVVWAVFQNIVSDAGEEISVGRINLDLEIVSVSGSGSDLIVNLQRGKGAGELEGIKFIVESESEQEILENSSDLDEFDAAKFSLTLNEFDFTDVKMVSVAPILSSGSSDIKDSYEVEHPPPAA